MDHLVNETRATATADDMAAQRARARDSLLLTAQLRIGGGSLATPVRVRNLSAGGLMAEYDGMVMIGDAIEIEVRGIGWTQGRVAWATDGRIGIAFTQPIDPLRARKPVGRPPRR